MRNWRAGLAAGMMALLAGTSVFAADLPGKFPGVTIDAKLIGGQQYEPLYARISEWEKETGAKVNILSKKNHFELDKEIKSDMASGSISWCVGSNHSSFAPQYPDLYTDLAKLLPKEEIAQFVDSTIAASTIDGRLIMSVSFPTNMSPPWGGWSRDDAGSADHSGRSSQSLQPMPCRILGAGDIAQQCTGRVARWR